MIKLLSFLITAFAILFYSSSLTFAQSNSFVSVVNPIRGADFWEEQQSVEKAFLGQLDILKANNLTATFLIRFDALSEEKIVTPLKNSNHEKGLFLEISPSWTNKAQVSYRQSESWHNAGSAFLSGYEREERIKLIDAAFEEFKETLGFYPKSVGAWWIDSYSLSYMQEKYNIISALIVADQYTTDNYQIWGQFWSTPYYPAVKNILHPSQTEESKLPVVIMQWAARDPVNGYGNGVLESTFSVQANDYLDYHSLDTKYFEKLVDIYTKQPLNQFNHLVVGLENSYSWDKYVKEYENQIKVLVTKKKLGQFSVVTMEDFATWYMQRFPKLSPSQIIVSDDPLGTLHGSSGKKTVWFMNPYYRAGWFFNEDGSVFRDIRQYRDGEEELCLLKRCDQVNFATSATRVLDDISFGQKLVVDRGKISDFNIKKSAENYILAYKNEAGKGRTIEFLPRDISIDGKVSSIDSIILEATKETFEKEDKQALERGSFSWSILSVFGKIVKFLAFLMIGCLIPGLFIINKILPKESSLLQKVFLATTLGLVLITLIFYLLSILNLRPLIFAYLAVNILLFLKFRHSFLISVYLKDKFNFLIFGLISAGTIFQQLPTFKNGLNFPFGLGFWGPNTHDGLWHISLINSLIKGVPPQNPIFAGEILKNYHYFYDLLVAATSYIFMIPTLDLLFRFYPILFSLLLGVVTYYLMKTNKLATLLGLYLVYFSGSFGWIVEFIKFRHLGGESAFWANQSISFNLNPPFAISLIIVIAIIQILPNIRSKLSIIILALIAGALISFKAYGGVLVLGSLLLVGIFKKSPHYLLTFVLSTILSTILFLSNFSFGKQLIIFSPFWFIHSMIDSPDRVGWVRLTLARVAGLEQGNWFKFFTAEIISLIIFIVGNLGTRVFAILSLIKLGTFIKNPQYLFIFLFAVFSLIIPILFIQAGNPWNTIQFIYYLLYISSIMGGYALAKILTSIPKIFALPMLIVFLVVTPINSWASASGYLSYNPHGFVSTKEFEALKILESKEEGVVLTYPYDSKIKTRVAEPWPLLIYDSTAYVSAISGKAVFIEDEPQNQILLTDYKKRLVGSADFFNGKDLEWSKDFLKSNYIKYIYLPKIHNVTIESGLPIRNLYTNSEVEIYEVIN